MESMKKGQKMSVEIKKKIGEANKIALIGNIPWNKGKKNVYSKASLERFAKAKRGKPNLALLGKPRSLEDRIKISEGRKGKTARENHPNWKGGISSELYLLRGTFEYKEWRKIVFRRDGWTCVLCKYRSKSRSDIQADHIKRFADFPELRFELTNGRTLCIPCHKKITFKKI